MHIDWFIVLVLAIAALFTGWSISLTGKGRHEGRGNDDRKTDTSH